MECRLNVPENLTYCPKCLEKKGTIKITELRAVFIKLEKSSRLNLNHMYRMNLKYLFEKSKEVNKFIRFFKKK